MKSTTLVLFVMCLVLTSVVSPQTGETVGVPNPMNVCPKGLEVGPLAGSAVISNGTVTLGVDDLGFALHSGVGLRYEPTGAEVLWIGCLCEGWGAADAVTGLQGWASIHNGGVFNVLPVSFASTPTTAVSITTVGAILNVTHDYHPTPLTPFLYEIDVTIENISGAPVDLRYTRDQDWDVVPTPFLEFVTIQGTGATPSVLYADNNGFQTPGPLLGRSSLGAVGDFVDFGPRDHGSLFDLGFGLVPPGASVKFTTYYGAAGTEADALAALAAVGATVYSLGQPSGAGGPDLGVPNTFIYAYRPIIPVSIDIKFCSNPNGFNCKSHGVLPVTIFGRADLDVTDIDIASLKLCLASDTSSCTSTPPVTWSIADRGDPTTDIGAAQCAIDPITGLEQHFLNPDGFLDLDVGFVSQKVAALIGCAALDKGEPSPTLVLVGELTNGQPIQSYPVHDVGIDQLLIQNK